MCYVPEVMNNAKVDNHGANAEAAYPLEGRSTVDMTLCLERMVLQETRIGKISTAG